MRPATWLYTVIGSLLLAAGIGLAVNFKLDIYGLFGRDRGRLLPAYGDERIAKYLLSERYVPANFNGLLIGSSVSANWNVRRLQSFQVYNESLNGGNIIEEKCIVEQALRSHQIRAALLLVHPSLTLSHTFQTVPLTPRENWAALGSQSLFEAYKDAWLRQRQSYSFLTDSYGTEQFPDSPRPLNEINVRLLEPHTAFQIDPVALRAYEDLLQKFCSYRLQVFLIVPPLSEKLLQAKRTEFDRYSAMIRSLAPKQAGFVDFTTDRYKSLREDQTNFSDGIHLTNQGADRVVNEVNWYLKEHADGRQCRVYCQSARFIKR